MQWCMMTLLSFFLGNGEGKPERGTLPLRTLNAYFAPVLLYDCLSNMQPESQAQTDTALSFDAFHAVESLPHTLLFGRCKPRPLIAYRNTRFHALFLYTNFNRAVLRGIFQGVCQIVADNLADALGIRKDRNKFFSRLD